MHSRTRPPGFRRRTSQNALSGHGATVLSDRVGSWHHPGSLLLPLLRMPKPSTSRTGIDGHNHPTQRVYHDGDPFLDFLALESTSLGVRSTTRTVLCYWTSLVSASFRTSLSPRCIARVTSLPTLEVASLSSRAALIAALSTCRACQTAVKSEEHSLHSFVPLRHSASYLFVRLPDQACFSQPIP